MNGGDRERIEEARARIQNLARESVARGDALAWFDRCYREAKGDTTQIPWADLEANPALSAWTSRPRAIEGARTAIVIGCGLGDDAEHLAAKGLDVTAFDISPTAIEWARRLHPRSRVRYEVADLFALPPSWGGRFDVVVEIYTLQALPLSIRHDAAKSIVRLIAPGGHLFLFARIRDDSPTAPPFDEQTSGPPWPLGRLELRRYFGALERVEPLTETRDPDQPEIVRAWAVFRREK